jgi:hypothetical protein
MDLDTTVNRSVLASVFPDLAGDANFRILSDCTNVYNCIAWAMGYSDRWVDICVLPGHWWPEGVERNCKPETLIEAFQSEGFEISDNRYVEDGYSKVVLYKKKNVEEWTHAARIVTSEIEYSKFGSVWDGQHSHNVLCRTGVGQESQSYGIAYAYMKRRYDYQRKTDKIGGCIYVNLENLAKLQSILRK